MESYILNDVEYDFKPLEIFVPDANYKVDKKELEKSKGKPEKVFAEDMIFPKRGILKQIGRASCRERVSKSV